MNQLERIIGTEKFRKLSSIEKERILELIDANPVFNFLLAGIMAESNWRRVLGEAYLKYVEAAKPQKAVAPVKAEPFAKKDKSGKITVSLLKESLNTL